MSEQDLVSEAKAYDPKTDAVNRSAADEVDAYFQTHLDDSDTPLQRGLFLAHLRDTNPAIVAKATQLMQPQPAPTVPDAAMRPTAAEKGSGQVPEPSVVPQAQLTPMSQGSYGSGRVGQLEDRANTINADIKDRLVPGTLPDPPAGGVQNASLPPEGPGRPYDILDPGKVALRSSQSSNQGVLDTKEMQRLREESLGLEERAADEEAFASTFATSERLRLLNDKQKQLIQYAKEDADFQDRQNKIAAETEGRIRAAEQALKEAEVDPNYNPMREIMEGDNWGKKIMLGMGVMFGSVGAAAQTNATGIYHANQFFEQYQRAVDRKVDLLEKRYKARKDYLGAAQDGYARMRQILQDEAATRAMIEARAWQMFDTEVDKIGQQYGLDTANAQFMTFRAALLNKKEEKLARFARTTQHVVGMQEQQKDLKVVPLGGGEDKTGANIKAIVQAREVKKLPIIEGAADNVATALSSMAKDSSYKDTIAHWLRTGGGVAKGIAPYIAENKDAFVRIAAAANDYVQSKAGSAQTEGEVARLAPVIGRGGADALEATKRFYDILQNERRAKQADIQAMDDYDVFEARKGSYSGQPKTQTYEPRVDPIGAPAVK
jgi:hypothetical protein